MYLMESFPRRKDRRKEGKRRYDRFKTVRTDLSIKRFMVRQQELLPVVVNDTIKKTKRRDLTVFEVYFDGGFNWCMYGSWEVRFCGFSKKVSREIYDSKTNRKTCNVAEYEALISALQWLQSVQNKERYAVRIWGDSQLVVRQVDGSYRAKKEHLQIRRDRVRWLLREFGDWSIHWHRRIHSVSRFGH